MTTKYQGLEEDLDHKFNKKDKKQKKKMKVAGKGVFNLKKIIDKKSG